MKVDVSVSDAGVVREVSLVNAPEPSLGQCVVEAMKHARFAKTMNGGTFVYPFVF